MKKKFRVSSLIKGIAVVYCLIGFVLFVVLHSNQCEP